MGEFFLPHEELNTTLTDLMLTLFKLPDELQKILKQISHHPYSEVDQKLITDGQTCVQKLITDTDHELQRLIQKLTDANIPLADVHSDKQPDRFQTKTISLWVVSYRKQDRIKMDCIAVQRALASYSH
jgi:hypothetical protein